MDFRRKWCRISQEECVDRAPMLIVGGILQIHIHVRHNVLVFIAVHGCIKDVAP